MPFTGTIIATGRDTPDRIALAEGTTTVSYGDLLEQSPIVYAGVHTLLAEAPEHDTGDSPTAGLPVVAISLSSALHAATLFAILAGYGVVTTIMDPQWPTAHRSRAIHQSRARVLVTDDDTFARELAAEGWRGAITTHEELATRGRRALADGEPAQPPSVRDDSEPFCLIFTSGTTDLPKGFLRTRHAWRYNVWVSRTYLRAAPQVRTLAPGPLAYSLTLYALVEVLGTGGSIWLQSRFDPIDAARTIDAEGLERLVAVPSVLPALAMAARRNTSQLPTLRDAVVGGANLSAALRTSFETAVPSATVLSYYGAAEIGFIGQSLRGEGTVLEPFDGVELSVRDETGAEVAPGELGQLFVRVASQGDHYLTADAPPITGPDGWSTVNDMARFADGVLVLEGRAGDIAVTGGHKVSLLQVERALETLWERSSVVTQPDAALGDMLVAVLEVRQGDDPPAKSELIAALGGLLPPQFVPQRVYHAAALPRTVGGKVRRGEVREQLEAGSYTRV